MERGIYYFHGISSSLIMISDIHILIYLLASVASLYGNDKYYLCSISEIFIYVFSMSYSFKKFNYASNTAGSHNLFI